MSSETPEGDLSAELRELGRNLKTAAKTAWESEESRRLQQELKNGLDALEAGLRDASSELSNAETRQRVRTEVHDMGERFRSGQVESQLRSDLLTALRTVNTELKKASHSAGDPSDKA
jgi:hypothetical protein